MQVWAAVLGIVLIAAALSFWKRNAIGSFGKRMFSKPKPVDLSQPINPSGNSSSHLALPTGSVAYPQFQTLPPQQQQQQQFMPPAPVEKQPHTHNTYLPIVEKSSGRSNGNLAAAVTSPATNQSASSVTHSRRKMKIPLIPGNFIPTAPKDTYNKNHLLNYINGYAVPRPFTLKNHDEAELIKKFDDNKARMAAMTYGKLRHEKTTSLRHVPAHVAFDKKVLSFDAYFKQSLYESNEQFLLRTVKIFYYLEDDSISVNEPKIENSGIAQGTLIKRHKIKKDNGDFFSMSDLQVGLQVKFYEKVFQIVACDLFTREFMASKGIVNPPNESLPEDKYIAHRELSHQPQQSTPADLEKDKVYRFLTYDRKVLRFYAIWDDRHNPFGELRDFIVHYYLVDDTVEVREVSKPNSGRAHSSVLLSRQKLVKNPELLVTIAPMDHIGDKDITTWREFRVGGFVDILNRPFLLKDCDAFTREYYQSELGVSQGVLDTSFLFPEREPIHVEIPEYNGFGTPEDSLQSWKNLVLKPPKKDFVKMLENDHKQLRFLCALVTDHAVDKERRFVVTYYLSDDTISIYETQQKNVGFVGGKFLERTRIKKPDGVSFYQESDLNVGTEIIVFCKKFRILDQDAFVTNWRASQH